jgi:hypothetical protein
VAYLQLLEQKVEMTEIERNLQKLEAEIDTKGGPLSKKKNIYPTQIKLV